MAGRRRLSEARRVQILDAAAQVIGRRGLCETRIADIASVAGTSSALVLYYFGSKDRLLAEALTYADERFYDETVEGLSEVGSARDRLVRLIDLSCPYEREGDRLDTWVLWLELWNRSPRDAEVAGSRHRLDRRWRDAIGDIVRDGIASGEFEAVDPDDFALRFASLVDGLAIQVVLDDPDVPRSRMLEVCLRIAGEELGFDARSAIGADGLTRATPPASPAPSSAGRSTQRAGRPQP
jgi:AcrR family transcriptional regulator